MTVAHRSVLVPLDRSVETERLMGTVCAIVDQDVSVTAVVVIEVPPLLPLDAQMDEEEIGARLLLARARAVGNDLGVRVVPRLVRSRGAAQAIARLADEERAELVVIGSRRHRGRKLERRLIRKAHCPVVVVAA
jgi:nucleotide-binding universal stress UspA family protein